MPLMRKFFTHKVGWRGQRQADGAGAEAGWIRRVPARPHPLHPWPLPANLKSPYSCTHAAALSPARQPRLHEAGAWGAIKIEDD
jgi:hypothetical protein